MTVGERIQRRREELGMSQTELARLMGYASKSAVSRAENSGDDIGSSRIVKFADALKTSPLYLMGWADADGNPIDKKRTTPSGVDYIIKADEMSLIIETKDERSGFINKVRGLSDHDFKQLVQMFNVMFPQENDSN